MNQKWRTETNSNPKKLKFHNYKNCQNVCLLNKYVESERIRDIFYIPVLHTVKLGPGNKLYKELAENLDLNQFETDHNIERDDYHGKTLEGNQINKLWNHIDELSEIVKTQDPRYLQYVLTLKELKKVDQLVNSKELNPNYSEIISDFSQSWLKCKYMFGTTVPNKVHIIQTHLVDYLNKQKSTLYRKTDQTMESVHQDLFSRMTASKYHVKNFKSDKHGQKLKQAATHYDSYNVGYGV
jgi:hypothetical protein